MVQSQRIYYWIAKLTPHFRTIHYTLDYRSNKRKLLKHGQRCPPGSHVIKVNMFVWLGIILWHKSVHLQQPNNSH